jgi:hypothetical protein
VRWIRPAGAGPVILGLAPSPRRSAGRDDRYSGHQLFCATSGFLRTMIDPPKPAAVRVRAAECVMTHSSKAIEIEDVELPSCGP